MTCLLTDAQFAALTLDDDDDDGGPWGACWLCGCTDAVGCPGGCSWVVDPVGIGDLCSACEDQAARIAEGLFKPGAIDRFERARASAAIALSSAERGEDRARAALERATRTMARIASRGRLLGRALLDLCDRRLEDLYEAGHFRRQARRRLTLLEDLLDLASRGRAP